MRKFKVTLDHIASLRQAWATHETQIHQKTKHNEGIAISGMKV